MLQLSTTWSRTLFLYAFTSSLYDGNRMLSCLKGIRNPIMTDFCRFLLCYKTRLVGCIAQNTKNLTYIHARWNHRKPKPPILYDIVTQGKVGFNSLTLVCVSSRRREVELFSCMLSFPFCFLHKKHIKSTWRKRYMLKKIKETWTKKHVKHSQLTPKEAKLGMDVLNTSKEAIFTSKTPVFDGFWPLFDVFWPV